jgi:hypothetical protein
MTAPSFAAPGAGVTPLALDHLVVGAATLEQGVAWCESTFGVTPGPGGRHAFMGTHNRLLRLVGDPPWALPDAYFEIIAVDPLAPAPARPRWFGLDRPAVQAALSQGPRLLHWVARTDDPDALRARWAALGLDPGPVESAERATPHGVLRWRITIPPDGIPPGGGTVPALIAWDGSHPATRLDADACLRLAGLRWSGAAALRCRLAAGPAVDLPSEGPGALSADLRGPGGRATLTRP